MSCNTFSTFSSSLNLRFSSTLTFFAGSPAPETHLTWLWLPGSDLGLAGEGLIPANIVELCSFSPRTALTKILLRCLKLISYYTFLLNLLLQRINIWYEMTREGLDKGIRRYAMFWLEFWKGNWDSGLLLTLGLRSMGMTAWESFIGRVWHVLVWVMVFLKTGEFAARLGAVGFGLSIPYERWYASALLASVRFVTFSPNTMRSSLKKKIRMSQRNSINFFFMIFFFFRENFRLIGLGNNHS